MKPFSAFSTIARCSTTSETDHLSAAGLLRPELVGRPRHERLEFACAAFVEIEDLGPLAAREGRGRRRLLELGDGQPDRGLADVFRAVGLRRQEEGLAGHRLDHALLAVGGGDLDGAAGEDVDDVIGVGVDSDLRPFLERRLEDAHALVVERLLVDARTDDGRLLRERRRRHEGQGGTQDEMRAHA